MNPGSPPLAHLHHLFLSHLPALEGHDRTAFRGRRDRDNLVQVTVALCWARFLRLAARGLDLEPLRPPLSRYSARPVRCGRRLCGMLPAHDAASWRAQRLHAFGVTPLQAGDRAGGGPLRLALQPHAAAPVPEQVAFRLDFPAWLRMLGRRNRKLLLGLRAGHRTVDVARRFGVSPARVAQRRPAFAAAWRRFTAGPGSPPPSPGPWPGVPVRPAPPQPFAPRC
jgi:hypothetical protein